MRFLEDDVEGGVLGRGREELERFLHHTNVSDIERAGWGDFAAASYRVSNLRTSAWEYAAPTTRLEPSRPAGFVALLLAVLSRNGGLQNGEADL